MFRPNCEHLEDRRMLATTPAPPVKFAWPLDENPGLTFRVTHGVDLDPSSGIRDYRDGNATYDGHNAWDLGPGDFYEIDRKIEVYAAARGEVIEVNDGEFDRRTERNSSVANYVMLDHGDGWTSFYWHLRHDSVQVEVGQFVEEGQLLGFMASSGDSDGPHVHFGIEYLGSTVEPALDPATYLKFSIPYVFEEPIQYASGISSYAVTDALEVYERPISVREFEQRSGQTAYAWGRFYGLESGDDLDMIWRRPDGTVYSVADFEIENTIASQYWWSGRNLPSLPQLGTWQVEFVLNGELLGIETFEVTPVAKPVPQVHLESVFFEEATYVPDERYTPILHFSGTSHRFWITNPGGGTLQLSDVVVPEGFTATGLSTTSVASDGFAYFDVGLTDTPGFYGGQIQILTNNPDDPIYNFSVEGTVASFFDDPLELGISERHIGTGDSIIANVRRDGEFGDLVVRLEHNANPNDLLIPTVVVIPSGSESANFRIGIPPGHQLTNGQTLNISASAVGHATAQNSVTYVPASTGIIGHAFPGDKISALNLGTGHTYQTRVNGNGSHYEIDAPSGWYTVTSHSVDSTFLRTPIVVGAGSGVANFDSTAPSLDERDDLVVTDNLGAYVAESGPFGMQASRYSDWVPNVINFGRGDLNGDGLEDIVGHSADGKIWVGLSTGLSSYAVKLFGNLSKSITWTNFTIADFDGDGTDDVMVRADSNGSWWVLKSNGNGFTYQQIAKFNPDFGWTFVTGDFNNDGREDLAGRAASNGSWWVGLSNGVTAPTSLWGTWGTKSSWSNYVVGDFDGDGRDDVAARANNQSLWVAKSNGVSFTSTPWAGWAGSSWHEFTVGDYDGDGDDDIMARALSTGDWWMAVSLGSSFSHAHWGNWPTYTNWHDVQSGDFNADGRKDLVGRADNGEWWILESIGSRFVGRFGADFGQFVSDSEVGNFGSGEPSSIGLVDEEALKTSANFPVDQLLVDFDNNHHTDFADFLILSTNFGRENASANEGDANGDKIVDFIDFLLLASSMRKRAEAQEIGT